MPKVSVIMPCYNHGVFIEEAIGSVLTQTFQDFEIIVVNNGSTDENTNAVLKNLSHPKVKVIWGINDGVSNARNLAIKEAKGEYILPLDSDDKIGPRYLEFAVEILDNNQNVGIVYCDAEFFGAQEGPCELPKYDPVSMLTSNSIFVSAVYRKTDWEKTNGYNPNMASGLEDWDFWLSMVELGVNVVKIDEILFYYRKHEKSSRNSVSEDKQKLKPLLKQIVANHFELYLKNQGIMCQLLEVDRICTMGKKAQKYKKFFNVFLIILIILSSLVILLLFGLALRVIT